jgi:DNA-binding transcriptional ArsR family regulator
VVDTLAALRLLSGGYQRYPIDRGWVNERRGRFNSMTRDPVRSSMVEVIGSTSWLPDFMTPPPTDFAASFTAELERVATTDARRARIDLRAAGAPPELSEREDVAQIVADLLHDVWHHFVRPEWRQRRAALERDVVMRANTLAYWGWAYTLEGLSPHMQWLEEGRLEVNSYAYPVQDLQQAELLLTPCSFGSSWLCLAPPAAYAIAYPASATWLPDTKTRSALDRLIGHTRAALLRALTNPATTTQLATQLHLSLGAVGDHLRVLRDAGIVSRVRVGREVLYQRTARGDSLAAQEPSAATASGASQARAGAD